MSKLHVLVTGGAGYVGAVLVPKLLARGHRVTVLDLYIFGDQVLKAVSGHPGLREVKGDIRDRRLLERELTGVDAVIHLACISNDPSFELNPELGKSINYDAFLAPGGDREGQGRAAVHLRLVVERVRHQGRGERHRGSAARAADRLLEVQGPLRGGAAEGAGPGLHEPDPAAGHRVRLLAAAAARPGGQHPHQPRGQHRAHHGVRRRPEAAQHPHRGHDRPLRAVARVAGRRASTAQIFNAGYENHTVSQLADMVARGRGPRARGHRDHAHRRPPLVPHLVGAHQADAGLRAEPQRRGSGARSLAPPTARVGSPTR